MKGHPKKHIVPVKFKDPSKGFARRASYSKEIMYKEPDFPLPLEYSDIDSAMNEFVDKAIELTDPDGNRVPTFTLYSTQRFSEYSQTWEHTDENGNLLMNFKTITRTNDVKVGSNQGGYWNIPQTGRYYTMYRKTVLDDDGSEHIEVYSMKQPYAVDISYRVNFVTNTFEMTNEFSMKILDLFKARQCYIRVNGRYIAMTLEEVNDETEYSIENRKFFVQSVVIKTMAYITRAEDYKVSKFPKETRLYGEGLVRKRKKKADVEVEEYQELKHTVVEINIDFERYIDKVEFDMDEDVTIQNVEKTNVSQLRLHINGMMIGDRGSFKIKSGNNVKLKIFKTDESKTSKVKLIGIKPNETYVEGYLPEDVSKTPVKIEEIDVE
jgi:hypothetical protein